MGLQIVRVILDNSKHTDAAAQQADADNPLQDGGDEAAAADNPVVGPIICLCFTNHALDQVYYGRLLFACVHICFLPCVERVLSNLRGLSKTNTKPVCCHSLIVLSYRFLECIMITYTCLA